MNDATLRQPTASAKLAAETLKDIARDVKESATAAGSRTGAGLADDVEQTAKDVEEAAKDAKDAAKHIDDVAQAARLADKPVDDLDDIELIERRMNARRASIRRHLVDARGNVERSARSWPIVAVGAVVAALAVGYVVARRPSRTQRTASSLWRKAREAPEAARRYVHEATKPPTRVWTERAGAAAGFAVAVARALPQIRALVAGLQAGRRASRH